VIIVHGNMEVSAHEAVLLDVEFFSHKEDEPLVRDDPCSPITTSNVLTLE
jgi:hypothetical protein